MDQRKRIPSMFHRRLLLLGAAFAVITMVLTGQMVRLSVVEGSERLAAAEAKLDLRRYLPTHRGQIVDRHGRVLAIDRASYDVAVQYEVITSAWPRNRAAAEAKKAAGGNRWRAMSPEQREEAINKCLPKWEAKCVLLWAEICRLGKVSPDEVQARLDAIKADVQTMAAVVWEQQRLDERIKYGITDDQEHDFKTTPIREQTESHVVLPRVPDEVAFVFRKLDQQLPGMIEVQDSRRREYPWLNAEVILDRASLPKPIRSDHPMTVRVAGVADHILGSVREEVWAQDIERRPFHDPKTKKVVDLDGYRRGDIVGARGVENVFEDALRGRRGEVIERRDTGVQSRIEPTPGTDVRLTIDVLLQARVQAILSHQLGLTVVQPWHHNAALPVGTPLNAAAVVIEVETGEILAMVSIPTVAMGELMSAEEAALNQWLVNRPVEAIYPPGSIIKPIVLAAAVTEGVHNLGSAIECTGHYFEDKKDAARCWIYREKNGFATHGSLHASEALGKSCNIFFYTLADRLGMDGLIKWFGYFGMGSPLDVGLLHTQVDSDGRVRRLGESAGDVPSSARIADIRRNGQLTSAEAFMGIGQGPISWTPVQAANAYAMLARGGVVRDATLVSNDPRGSRPQRCEDLHLSWDLVATALEGLRQSVMERYGTGHHITYDDQTEERIINAEHVTVWAKTGTAQWDIIRRLDHSWFVGLVGPQATGKPMHAIAVIVENGGSGGRCAGPVANQIVRALQAEGYLPGDSAAARRQSDRDGQPASSEDVHAELAQESEN